MAQTIFITGASSGIGQQTALLFQQRKWNVVATMRSPEKDTVLRNFTNVICLRLDVTEERSIKEAVKNAIAHFGRIDVVINNAGYGLIGAFETFDAEQIERQFKTNVFGLMSVMRSVLPHFRANHAGLFINVASFAGRSIFPLYSVYHASKWAVEGFTESLHYEFAQHNIRVKLIEPGIVRTEFWGRSTDRQNHTGVDAYDAYGNPVLDVIDNAARLIATHPQEVATTIWKAANDASPRLRYIIGLDARLTLGARRVLSDKRYTQLINGVFSGRAQRLWARVMAKFPAA